MKTYEVQTHTIEIKENIRGNILDIGGGGEGIIGRAYKSQVTAIDKRQDELDEAPCDCTKIVMDAADLKFDKNHFDTVTSFYTLMYISNDMHAQILKEAYRVLKPGGRIIIWEAVIPENTDNYEVFIIQLKVKLPGKTITADYGTRYSEQDISYYTTLLKKTGFKIIVQKHDVYSFKIIAEKR